MALTVSSTIPTGAQQNVAPNAYFKIQFNSEVSPNYYSDLNVGNYFQLYKTDGFQRHGVVAGKLSGDPNTVYILPQQELAVNTGYTFIVVAGVKNVATESLASNYVLTFTTGSTAQSETITITNGEVTIVQSTPDPGTPTPTEPGTVSFVDVNNRLVGSESGTGAYYYEDPAGLVSELYMEYSSPEDGEVGVRELVRINTYWNRGIADRYISEVSVRKTQLPFEPDIFGDHDLVLDGVAIDGNRLFIDLSETGADVTTNYEYAVTIPSGALTGASDASLRNTKTMIRFAGPLSPLYATPEMVRMAISPTGDPAAAGDYDDYSLYKRIHMISKDLVALLGREPDPTSDEMFWVSRYVVCRAAWELLRGPLPSMRYVQSRTVLGQSVSWTTSGREGDRSPLEDCMKRALNELGIAMHKTGAEIGVKSMDSRYYPGRRRFDDESELSPGEKP